MTAKEKIKQRFDAVFPSLMEAGEQPVAGGIVMSGPNIWLIGPLLQRWYFIEVTDRRVLFINCSKATPSPKGLAWADPRYSVQVHDVAMDLPHVRQIPIPPLQRGGHPDQGRPVLAGGWAGCGGRTHIPPPARRRPFGMSEILAIGSPAHPNPDDHPTER